jgi:hypothetical protein
MPTPTTHHVKAVTLMPTPTTLHVKSVTIMPNATTHTPQLVVRLMSVKSDVLKKRVFSLTVA